MLIKFEKKNHIEIQEREKSTRLLVCCDVPNRLEAPDIEKTEPLQIV